MPKSGQFVQNLVSEIQFRDKFIDSIFSKCKTKLRYIIHIWTGVNLYQIAVHEIGHALGLKHSNIRNSVMWPKHDGYKSNYTLDSDDIHAIQVNGQNYINLVPLLFY